MGSRTDAIETLGAAHRALGDLFARLPDDAFSRRGTIGGGEWSAKDLAGHIAVWEEQALGAIGHARRGERPSIEDWFAGEQTDRFNEQEVRRSFDDPPDAVRARFERAHRDLVEAIAAMTDEEWEAPYAFDPTGEDRTLGARLGSLTCAADGRGFAHAFDHLEDLRAYVEST